VSISLLRRVLFVPVLFALVACTNFQILDSTARPILLPASYERTTIEEVRVRFPQGSYVPDFKTKTGLYYRAPDKLAAIQNGETRGRNGGLYVPSPNDPDQRQGVWFEEQEPSGGEIKAAVAAPTKTYRFSEPISFQVQNP